MKIVLASGSASAYCLRREDSPLTDSMWEHQHGEAGGNHLCLGCGRVYPCSVMHPTAGEKVRASGRWCAACRRENVAALDRLEEVRRRSLYVG